MMITRCEWAGNDPLYVRYHDEEWGVPIRGDDRKLFEFLTLEGFQAGLSWLTILRKRENFRRAFDEFNPHRIAYYGEKDVARLMADAGIIRNKAKINATIGNARAFLKVQEEFGTFDAYVWQFVDGKPIQNSWRELKEIPAKTQDAGAMSKDLVKRGFKFVGPTICYAHMQATGMVNDHTVYCFRHADIVRLNVNHISS
jgi:DNA-3-methyladenine glycosylase I